MSKKPQITVTPRQGDIDLDAIIAKRLAGNPFGGGTTEVPLAEPERWDVYIANGDLHPSRLYEMKMRLGWVEVTAADLAPGITPESIGFSISETGALCRGPRGQEVVFKQPKAIRAKIMERKTDVNKRGMGDPKTVKADMVNAAGASHGDEAANFLNKHVHVTGYDRVEGGRSSG